MIQCSFGLYEGKCCMCIFIPQCPCEEFYHIDQNKVHNLPQSWCSVWYQSPCIHPRAPELWSLTLIGFLSVDNRSVDTDFWQEEKLWMLKRRHSSICHFLAATLSNALRKSCQFLYRWGMPLLLKDCKKGLQRLLRLRGMSPVLFSRCTMQSCP